MYNQMTADFRLTFLYLSVFFSTQPFFCIKLRLEHVGLQFVLIGFYEVA